VKALSVIGVTLVLVVATIASTGCGHQKSTDRVAKVWGKIHVGMPATQARAILGKPDRVFDRIIPEDDEVWWYGTDPNGADYIVNIAPNGAVGSKEFDP
jgi:hypothetical protein